MRVTIAVDGVLREIEVRPDLLSPGMGEWQDATEMDLLRAFGSAYKEAVASRPAAAVTTLTVATSAAAPGASVSDDLPLVADEPTDEPTDVAAAHSGADGVVDAFPDDAGVQSPVYDGEDDGEDDGEEDLYAAIEPIEPNEQVALSESVEQVEAGAGDDPQTPFAAAPVEFAQAQVYAPSEDDASAFLPPEGEHAASVAPVVTMCVCGHVVAWHPDALDTDEPGACQMAWPIDEHEPDGPASRCACLRFTPVVFPDPVG